MVSYPFGGTLYWDYTILRSDTEPRDPLFSHHHRTSHVHPNVLNENVNQILIKTVIKKMNFCTLCTEPSIIGTYKLLGTYNTYLFAYTH